MNIKELHENWTELGKDDPMWVVLTDPSKKGNRWDEGEFFETGRREVDRAIGELADAGIPLRGDRALDFGCGLGRLSQALAKHFTAVDGVDISASMVDQARVLNRQGGRVSFHLNVQPDLRDFASNNYDFIYSVIALQHTPAKFQAAYIADFVRLLRPGGTACFQTIHAHGWRSLVPESLADLYRKRRSRGQAFIPMYGITHGAVTRAVRIHGGVIRDHKKLAHGEAPGRYATDIYVVQKKP